MQQVSYGPLIMSIMSCYIGGFFNVRRGWQSLNTRPRFYLRLIRRTGWLWIHTSRTTDGRPFKPKKLSVPFLCHGVPAGLTTFRGLVPIGWRNLVPILPPAHPLGGGVIIQYDINLIKNLKNALYLTPKIEQGMIKVDKTVEQFVKDIHVY